MEIDASPGSLSRIEHGITNPSKETLLKIADVLKLTKDEKTKLFGLVETQPTEEDIFNAKESLRSYLNRSDVFAILIDERGFMLDASDGMLQLLNVPEHLLSSYIGKHLLVIQVDPKFGIWNILDDPEEVVTSEVALFMTRTKGRENEKWYQELMRSLNKFEGFKSALKKAEKMQISHLPKESRIIKLKLGGKIITLFSHFTKLESDSRFELIDYIIKE
jgi:transcriptional regulator with XRE-family HTH domain